MNPKRKTDNCDEIFTNQKCLPVAVAESPPLEMKIPVDSVQLLRLISQFRYWLICLHPTTPGAVSEGFGSLAVMFPFDPQGLFADYIQQLPVGTPKHESRLSFYRMCHQSLPFHPIPSSLTSSFA